MPFWPIVRLGTKISAVVAVVVVVAADEQVNWVDAVAVGWIGLANLVRDGQPLLR